MAREHYDVRGRVALVTGAARGIGLDTAQRLARRGAQVSLVGLEADRLEAEASALGESAAWFEADVSDKEAVEAAVNSTVERFGGIDVVVANAGIAPPTATVASIDAADWERVVAVNLFGVWHTVKALLPHVIERRGYTLIVASVAAAINSSLGSSYGVSKAAVEQLGRGLRVELAPHGASAGVAYFGFIDTDMVREVFSRPDSARMRERIPSLFSRPVPLARAGEAIEHGIERRAARITAPGWVRPALALRGITALADSVLARDAHVQEAIRAAEARAEDP